MTIIAVSSTKHAPGATTLVVALAGLMNDEPTLVIEADRCGGDIAARAGLALDPGVLSLAAAARRGLTPDLVDVHSQRLHSGAQLLAAPTSADRAGASMATLAEPLAALCRSIAGRVIVDLGRWDQRSPASHFARTAEVVLVLLRPTVEGVEHARWCLHEIDGAHVVPVLIGERPYRKAEVETALGREVTVVADDPGAASIVGTGIALDRWTRRFSYVRSVAALADQLRSTDLREAAAS